MHRQLTRSGLPFRWTRPTCTPAEQTEFKPILCGRMRPISRRSRKRFSPTATVAICVAIRPAQTIGWEWLQFGWFFLVTRRDPKACGSGFGCAAWAVGRSLASLEDA